MTNTPSTRVIEVRTYTCHVGMLEAQMRLHINKGLPIQIRHFGEPLAFMSAETGNPNQYTHIWQFASADKRMAQRKALYEDPEWLTYLQESSQLNALITQENQLMIPQGYPAAMPYSTGEIS